MSTETNDDDVDLSQIEAIIPVDPALLEVAEQTTYGEILLADLVRRQLILALSVAAVFVLGLLALPLVDLLFPQVAATSVFGLPLSWAALAIFIYPILWVLAAYYVSTSKKYEDEFTRLVR